MKNLNLKTEICIVKYVGEQFQYVNTSTMKGSVINVLKKEKIMRLTNSKEIMEFRFAVSKCRGDVWLEDQEGNKFNLKSVIS
jgi:hypothetical protein